MRLTVYTDYTLRLLMYLALKKDGLATIAEIAATYDISRNHLMKVAHELSIAGYVVTCHFSPRQRRGAAIESGVENSRSSVKNSESA